MPNGLCHDINIVVYYNYYYNYTLNFCAILVLIFVYQVDLPIYYVIGVASVYMIIYFIFCYNYNVL